MIFDDFLKIYQKKIVDQYNNTICERPLISISVVTYQHINYIKECLDGILMQETNFQFEILLGDDDSTDGTREICIEYAEKYPNQIRLFLHHRENNIKINGSPTGRFNFLYNLYNAHGKYIALCEGDDYWTDPLKLQKQVDFLEANPDYNICFHKVKILRNNSLHEDVNIEKRYNSITNLPATVNDLIKQGNFMHTPSVMYRRDKIKIPFELSYSSVGDYFMHIIVSKNGYIKRIEETMAVYREGVGIYSTLSDKEMQKKILNYQICILSYLEDPNQKEIILQKILKSINDLNRANILNDKSFSTQLSMKQLIKIILLKIKQKFK
jgi:glycosyltransferase involved in cell wall biosynthesis